MVVGASSAMQKAMVLLLGLSVRSYALAKGDHLNPDHSKRTRGAGGQVYAASVHERAAVIDPDGDASAAYMRGDRDL